MQLQRDAQEERDVERVVVGRERPRRRAARDRLHDRRLHLQEPAGVQERAHGLDEARPEPEHLAHARIHEEIHVPLPVASLDVLEPVPLLGQRPDGLREERPRLHLDGQLPRARPHEVAGHADEVRHVQLGEAGVGVSEDVGARVELDRARLVEEVGEAGLAVVADRHDAPGDADRARRPKLVLGRGIPASMEGARPVRHRKARAERVHARVAEGAELFVTPANELVPRKRRLACHLARLIRPRVGHGLPTSAPRTGTPR